MRDTVNTKNAARQLRAPRTLGELRGLLSAALAIVEGKRLTRLARRDLAALLRAALRYRQGRVDG